MRNDTCSFSVYTRSTWDMPISINKILLLIIKKDMRGCCLGSQFTQEGVLVAYNDYMGFNCTFARSFEVEAQMWFGISLAWYTFYSGQLFQFIRICIIVAS